MPHVLVVDDPALAACLARYRGNIYLSPYFGDPCSVTDAADYLREPLAKTHYWTRRWRDLGALEVVDEVRRAGRSIKLYRTIADEFVVPAALLPENLLRQQLDRLNEEMVRALTHSVPEVAYSGDLRIHREPGQRHVSTDRTNNPAVPAPGLQVALHSNFEVALTDEEARQARRELMAFRDRWTALGHRAQPETHMFVIGMAPMPPDL